MPDDTTYRPADTDNDIERKILVQYGGRYRIGDLDNDIYRKILTQLGGTFRPGDGTSELLRKIATRVGADPRPGDTTNKLLYRIDQSVAVDPPRPGDYDNALLRKWLSPNALNPTPGTHIEIIPQVNPAHTLAQVTVNITGGDNLVGSWLGFWAIEYQTPGQNITANYQLKATALVIAMPFSVTFSIPVPSTIPSTVCIALVKGPTQASVSTSPFLTKGAYKQCFSYSSGFIVVNINNAPAAPVATAATALAETSFSANWNASSGATSYRLDVSTVSNFASFVTGYNNLNVGNVTTASVTGLTGSTTYYFRVRAVNGFGTSGNSNTITGLTVPVAPVATAATTIAETSFDANWNATTGASGYFLDVAIDAGFSSFVSGFNNLNVGNVLTQAVTGLTGGTTYYFRVRSSNASGTSANSNTITTLTVPAAVTATAATNVTDVSFSANWNAQTGATGYRLDVATDSGFSSFVTGFNNLDVSNVTTYSVTGLTQLTTYYYRVRAYNASGTGANSNTITQATVATTPSAPTATAATSVTDVTFSANWGAVTGATGYKLDVATDAGFSSFVTGFNDLDVSNVVTYSVTGLTQNTTYYFRVRAYNTGGTSGNSNTISTTTYDTEVLDWVSRVVGNGGSVSQGTKDAANTFMVSLKTNSIRSLVYRINLYAGTGLAACAVPFIKDKGNTLDSLNNFVSGDYSESTGLTGNGSTKWVNTGLNLSTDISSINSMSFAAYIRSNTQEDKLTMGAVTSGDSTKLAYLYIRDSSNIRKGVACAENGARNDGTTSLGLWHISRTSSSLITFYRNGSSLATDAGSAGTLPNLSMYVHCWNDSVFGASTFTSRPLGGYLIGAGFSSTQASNFYTAWQAFQTALGRNV